MERSTKDMGRDYLLSAKSFYFKVPIRSSYLKFQQQDIAYFLILAALGFSIGHNQDYVLDSFVLLLYLYIW